MCTAIAYKGNDLIYGFNLDVDPKVWNFSIHKTKFLFALGVTVGKTTYYVHGVNKNSSFGNTPYMNGEVFPVPHGAKKERIDLLNDRYIRGKYTFDDVKTIISEKSITSIPQASMHSLIGNGDGEFLIIEPGYGHRYVTENYAFLTNFPVLTALADYANPFYGKDRYDKAFSVLSSSRPDFSVCDALKLLEETKQEGQWGTRISFVYSKNGNCVYYCENGMFSHIEKHVFE